MNADPSKPLQEHPQDHPVDQLRRAMHDLRISVTDRCNFRCTYCMPAEIYGERYQFLPKPEILTFEEIHRLATIFVELGVEKLRITGGEPLLRSGLPSLIAALASIKGAEDLSLTTNGYLLGEQAESLAQAGLHRATVSLDSLDPQTFQSMSGGIRDPQVVLEAIDAAQRFGLGPVKINCVVQRGVNEADVLRLARHFRGSGHIVRFIEFMDVGTRNNWGPGQVVSREEILEQIDREFPLEAVTANYQGEVATRYCYRDGSGEIGVIASVTQPFCRGCTRARLTTDGQFVTCLFAEQGIDLRTPLRSGASNDEIAAIIGRRWQRRDDRYSEVRGADPGAGTRRIEMYQIGG